MKYKKKGIKKLIKLNLNILMQCHCNCNNDDKEKLYIHHKFTLFQLIDNLTN